MPIKIRLQRRGKKGLPFYHIVVADSRFPRDGKSLGNIGIYNPITNTIKMHLNNTILWLDKGAQPTTTARSLLSKLGILYNRHLLIGVRKGAFDKDEAKNRFEKWIKKNSNIYVDKTVLIFLKKK